MKRKEIKDILFDMGASQRLLEMPAVMERMYNYYIEHSEEDLRKEINIGSNGEIICEEKNKTIRVFRETENGEAIFANHDLNGKEQAGKYSIDKFGMDRRFDDYSEPLFEQQCTLERTEDGKISINFGKKVVEDQGDPILNFGNYTIIKTNATRTIGWEGNREFLTQNYPITKEWFAVREGIKTEEIEEEITLENRDEVENLKNRIKTIEEQHKGEVEGLRKEIDKLTEEKTLLQSMLKRTLDVCETVKRSPVGKMFFGRKLKELPEPTNIDER